MTLRTHHDNPEESTTQLETVFRTRRETESRLFEEQCLEQEKEAKRPPPNKPCRNSSSMLDFKAQLDRPPIAKDTDPPHPDRFNFDGYDTLVSGKIKKPKTFQFSK
jgi:hypothetical protein